MTSGRVSKTPYVRMGHTKEVSAIKVHVACQKQSTHGILHGSKSTQKKTLRNGHAVLFKGTFFDQLGVVSRIWLVPIF